MSTGESERRQAIVAAALRVFAAEGYHKATIKQIAREAGLRSPSLIYWYFRDKQALLQAVVSRLSPLVRQAASPDELMERPPAEVLRLIMHLYYQTLDQREGPHMMRLLFSEAVRTPVVAEQVLPSQRAVIDVVTGYLRHQMALGRLRPHVPEAAARAFLGAMFAYVLSRDILPGLGEGLPTRDTYVEQVVAILLDGLQRA